MQWSRWVYELALESQSQHLSNDSLTTSIGGQVWLWRKLKCCSQCCKSFTGCRMRDRANVFVCKDWVDTCLEIYEEIFRKFSEYSLRLWIQSKTPHSTYIMNFFYLILCHYEDAVLSGWASVGNLLSVPFEWYLNHLDPWSSMDVASTNVFTYVLLCFVCLSPAIVLCSRDPISIF